MSKKIITALVALEKIRAWCAYQERYQEEVRRKLLQWGIDPEVAEHHIATLIEEDFLNEERFAKAFARGKFRIKKWGRRKILYELRKRGLSEYCIRVAMKEIPEEDIAETLKKLVEKLKREKSGIKSLKVQNYKITTYLINRGFDVNAIRNALNKEF